MYAKRLVWVVPSQDSPGSGQSYYDVLGYSAKRFAGAEILYPLYPRIVQVVPELL